MSFEFSELVASLRASGVRRLSIELEPEPEPEPLRELPNNGDLPADHEGTPRDPNVCAACSTRKPAGIYAKFGLCKECGVNG
jgi:hypothetical protein